MLCFVTIYILKFTIQEDKLKILKLVSTGFEELFSLVYRLITLYVLNTVDPKVWTSFCLKNKFN